VDEVKMGVHAKSLYIGQRAGLDYKIEDSHRPPSKRSENPIGNSSNSLL
jgi:hypothetical protein